MMHNLSILDRRYNPIWRRNRAKAEDEVLAETTADRALPCKTQREAQMTKHNRPKRWSRFTETAILIAAAVVAANAARADQAVKGEAATGAPSVSDLRTTPPLANPTYPPVNPDRTLHNNISWPDHVASKKKRLRAFPVRQEPKLQK
jgi:hypothetical protein